MLKLLKNPSIFFDFLWIISTILFEHPIRGFFSKMIFEMAFPLGYTRYVYVTHLCVRVLCKSDGTQCRLCLVGPRGFGERFVWSRLAHFDASKSTFITSITLHHFRFNIRTRDWPWHISRTLSRIPLAIPHVGRAIFERDSNDQATRPTFAGWISFIVLLFLSSFRRVFDRVLLSSCPKSRRQWRQFFA